MGHGTIEAPVAIAPATAQLVNRYTGQHRCLQGGLVPATDSEWWTAGSFDGQPMTEILAARDFGKVFAFLRQRGWSVGALSAATQIDEYRVREIIKGKRQIALYEVIERVVLGWVSIVIFVALVPQGPPVTTMSGRAEESSCRTGSIGLG
jgi:hypothetical protein